MRPQLKVLIICIVISIGIGLTIRDYQNRITPPSTVRGTNAHAEMPLTLMTIREAQIYLKDLGYYDDDIDCIVGPNTIDAWERYSGNIDASGYINDKSVRVKPKDIGEMK